MTSLLSALRASLPVMFGYLPLGIAFGILFQDLGYPWYLAGLMGLVVFAGAAQFMAVGLLAAQASLPEVAISTLALNARHIFFGLSLLHRYPARGWRRFYLIFGLTDETYSLITGTPPPDPLHATDYYLAVTALNHGYWVLGCTLGALIGQALTFDTQGMDFALTALFLVLLVEQWKSIREPWPFLVAGSCGLLAILLFRDQMLLVSLSLTLILLLLHRRRIEALP